MIYFFPKLLISLISQCNTIQGSINFVAHSIKFGTTYDMLTPIKSRTNQSNNIKCYINDYVYNWDFSNLFRSFNRFSKSANTINTIVIGD